MTVSLLLPFDGSPGATRSCELIARFAGGRRTLDVLVVAVQSPPLRFWPGASLNPSAIEAALIEAGRKTAGVAPERMRTARVPVQTAVRVGSAPDVILDEAFCI